jgi:hypothetical protein
MVGEQTSRAWIAVASVAQSVWTGVVVAFDDNAHPILSVTRDAGNFLNRIGSAKQPKNMVVAAFNAVLASSVAPFQFGAGQVFS